MAPSIVAEPRVIEDPDATARSLAQVLGADPARLRARLHPDRAFTYVARWVTPDQASRVSALALPGIGVADEPRRA